MKPQSREEDIVELLSSVPIGYYEKSKKSYSWPRKNRCIFCGEGKYDHIDNTTILVCRVCGSELHIPHES